MAASHNKKRNTALLYEFLIRHISKCLVENRKEDANLAVSISKKYFSEGMPLRNELNLLNNMTQPRVNSKAAAQKILDHTNSAAVQMNSRLLDEQKSKLIKEINYNIKQEEFYNARIPHYTIYASAQMLINDLRSKSKTLNVVDKVKLEEKILDHLAREHNKEEDILKVNPNYSNTVYKFLLQRFHQKYEGKLNESQKKLLTQYALYLISNKPDGLKEHALKEINKIKVILSSIKDENVKADKSLCESLLECKKKVESFSLSEITEQKVLDILQYMKLAEEIES